MWESLTGRQKIIKSSEPCIVVYSDASLVGFSATHGNDWLAGNFNAKAARNMGVWLGHHFAEAKDAGCRMDNINVLELWPILVGEFASGVMSWVIGQWFF